MISISSPKEELERVLANHYLPSILSLLLLSNSVCKVSAITTAQNKELKLISAYENQENVS